MSTVKVGKYVEQPHQRFVYVFDPDVQWTFLIEMIKIAEESAKITYPSIIKSQGNSPKQYKQINLVKEDLGPESLLDSLLDEPEVKDEEIFKGILDEDGVEEDELKSLEGEEGEEDIENESEEDSENESDFEYSDEEDN